MSYLDRSEGRPQMSACSTRASGPYPSLGYLKMNQTQAAGLGGLGGSALTAALTTVLTGMWGLDSTRAAAFAFIILFVLGVAYSLASWFISWKWPSAPPLPNLSADQAAQLAQAHADSAKAAAEAANVAAAAQQRPGARQ